MDHSHMHHMGHDMDPSMMCSMKMIFNYDLEGVCVVFSWWRINGAFDMVLSCLAVAALAVGYEWLKMLSSRYDQQVTKSKKGYVDSESSSSRRHSTKRQQLWRSIWYALLVGYSFMLMLVFMTFNAYLMISMVVGTGIGFYLFGGESAARSMACH
ncbi:uncharacterized protein VTP21DRAFT_8780 [Calcarisporiella thermophila]|uniref:uncharacterized protein n=1 Tax=Calcarisporiella thermophila TaxID=911321 RepID=UPI003742BC7F